VILRQEVSDQDETRSEPPDLCETEAVGHGRLSSQLESSRKNHRPHRVRNQLRWNRPFIR
jgi:hypothetical protein